MSDSAHHRQVISTAKSIAQFLQRLRVNLENEKSAQSDIAEAFSLWGCDFQREIQLSKKDIIDFICGSIGIEVKLRGWNKLAVYRQLERYAVHDQIECLILASNLSMRLPEEINGKPVFQASIGEGWL